MGTALPLPLLGLTSLRYGHLALRAWGSFESDFLQCVPGGRLGLRYTRTLSPVEIRTTPGAEPATFFTADDEIRRPQQKVFADRRKQVQQITAIGQCIYFPAEFQLLLGRQRLEEKLDGIPHMDGNRDETPPAPRRKLCLELAPDENPLSDRRSFEVHIQRRYQHESRLQKARVIALQTVADPYRLPSDGGETEIQHKRKK